METNEHLEHQDTPELPEGMIQEIPELPKAVLDEINNRPKALPIHLHKNTYKLFKALQGDLRNLYGTEITASAAVKHLLLWWFDTVYRHGCDRTNVAQVIKSSHHRHSREIIDGKKRL